MSKIAIKDLTKSIDLDQEAMTAITGGARTRGYRPVPADTIVRAMRIVDYPPGMSDAFYAAKRSSSK